MAPAIAMIFFRRDNSDDWVISVFVLWSALLALAIVVGVNIY